MRILYIWDADYPWDIRVSKITRYLFKEGHQVHIVSRNILKRPIREWQDGILIHRLNYFYNERINKFLSVPMPINPFWLKKIGDIVKNYKIQIIIVRDLPLALSAVIIGKLFQKPIIFDMAENYPALMAGINNRNKSLTNKIFRNPFLAVVLERFVCKKVDFIIAVVEESKDRLINLVIAPKKIIIVGNTPEINFFKKKAEVSKSWNEFILLYIGGVQMGRGIQTVIEAIPIIKKQIPNMKFQLIGDGYALDRLKSLVVKENVEDVVEFLGFIQHRDLSNYIFSSDICVIPHRLNEQTLSTIPNKLFDYMAMGKPVVATDINPITRIIKEAKCGLTFKNKDKMDFAQKVIMIKNNESKVEFGKNGQSIIKTKYNWDTDFSRLKNCISSNFFY